MSDLIQCETETYRAAFADPAYRVKCHGLTLWQTRRDLFPASVATAVDLGCGTGRLVGAWRTEGIAGIGVDLDLAATVDPELYRPDWFTAAALWDWAPQESFDLGVCADVMEHIPEAWVRPALERIASCCRTAVFKIANFPSVHHGVNLHPTRQPQAWWYGVIWSTMGGTVTPVAYETRREEYVFRWRRHGPQPDDRADG